MNGFVSENSSFWSEAPGIFCRDVYTLPIAVEGRVGRSQEARRRESFCPSPRVLPMPLFQLHQDRTQEGRATNEMLPRPGPSTAGTEITSHGQGGWALMARTSDRATGLEKGRAQGPLWVWPWRHRSLYPRTPQTPSCMQSCHSLSGSRQAWAQGGPGRPAKGSLSHRPEPPACACPLGGNPGSVGLAAHSIQKSSL